MTKFKTNLKHALESAKITQDRYTDLKSPSTQNVRNPFPMWKLVQQALPALPLPTDKIQVEVTTKFTLNGKKFVKKQMAKKSALQALGMDFYINNSSTVEDVVRRLEVSGFIARRGTVAQAINWCRYISNVNRVKIPGTRKTKYFIPAP